MRRRDEFISREAFAALTALTLSQVEYYVRAGIVRPAVPASRRGVSRRYSVRNVVQATVGRELIKAGILAWQVKEAVRMVTGATYWPRLCDPAQHADVAVLLLTKPARDLTKPAGNAGAIDMRIVPAQDVGDRCGKGLTVMAAVPLAFIMRRVLASSAQQDR